MTVWRLATLTADTDGRKVLSETRINTAKDWLPPRDSNPDMLIQSQLSYH